MAANFKSKRTKSRITDNKKDSKAKNGIKRRLFTSDKNNNNNNKSTKSKSNSKKVDKKRKFKNSIDKVTNISNIEKNNEIEKETEEYFDDSVKYI